MTKEIADPGRTVSFLGSEIALAPGVLVPRGETELLARHAIELLAGHDVAPTAIDMCCGSGNLAIALARAYPTAQIWASDLTEQTIALTRLNCERLALSGRIAIYRGDMFAPLLGQVPLDGVDLVVANPPYISSAKLETERHDLLEREPREAFDGGPYGISILQRLIGEAHTFLRPGGWLAFEFGLGQERQAKALIARARAYGPPRFVDDDCGNPRVAIARKV